MIFKIQLVMFLLFVCIHSFVAAQENRAEPMREMYIHEHTGYFKSRFRRENPVSGHKKYVRAVQPNVVVMPSVPNTGYGYSGVPGSSYSSYGVNRAPTVVVSMPNDVYNTPVVANPYGIPARI